MKSVLDEAGIEVTPGNKKELDQAFHQIVGVTYKDCPTTWKRLKREEALHCIQEAKLAEPHRSTPT